MVTKSTFLGKEHEFFFGMPAVEYVYEKIDGAAFNRLASGEFHTSDVKVIAHFVYAGLLGAADRRDEAMSLTFGDVYDGVELLLLEGDKDGVMEAVGKAFSESNTVKYYAGPKVKGKKKESTGVK